ncbi:hypothetical protein J504_0350 [Acinetobacter baumannii 348935]|nr:hypothetical protein J504_0350 [Acinetobacter baumannii 348935]
MKIKEGGGMDIQNIDLRRGDFEAMHPKAKLFGFDEDKKLYTGDGVESINDQWTTWCACIGMLCLDGKESQAVPEWKDYELEKPNDGQKCLVIFESKDCEDAQRWMCIDEFNEGMFDFIANWEDQCASVALPAGSIISKVRAVCWTTTNLSNVPLSFDQFYEAQEPAND